MMNAAWLCFEVTINLFQGWLYTTFLNKVLTARTFRNNWTQRTAKLIAILVVGGYLLPPALIAVSSYAAPLLFSFAKRKPFVSATALVNMANVRINTIVIAAKRFISFPPFSFAYR